jgi:hypothetical protein
VPPLLLAELLPCEAISVMAKSLVKYIPIINKVRVGSLIEQRIRWEQGSTLIIVSRVLSSRCRLSKTNIVDAVFTELSSRSQKRVVLQLSHPRVPCSLQFSPLCREVLLLRYHPR